MKKFLYICRVLLLLVIFTSCQSYREKIKPNPDKEKYIKCPVCSGYGYVKIHSVPENKNEPEIDEDSSCYKALYGAGCLFWLGHEIAHSDDMEYRERQRKNDIRNTEESVSDDQTGNIERSGVSKKTKCHRCEGTGWIKTYESDNIPIYDEKYMKSLNDANELIDQ